MIIKLSSDIRKKCREQKIPELSRECMIFVMLNYVNMNVRNILLLVYENHCSTSLLLLLVYCIILLLLLLLLLFLLLLLLLLLFLYCII